MRRRYELTGDAVPSEINGDTERRLLPKGYFFMFSTLDYFSQRLTFQNINLLSPVNIGDIFYPPVRPLPFQSRVCSNQLLFNVEQILGCQTEFQELAGDLVDSWAQEAVAWKQVGLFSVFYDRMMNFVKKKSILIDDSVFLISTSGSDSEAQLVPESSCPSPNE